MSALVSSSHQFMSPPKRTTIHFGGVGFPGAMLWPNLAKSALHFATHIARIRGMGNVLEYLGQRPQIGAGVFIADNARVIGDTQIGEQSSIWFSSVLRGDINRVVIGHHTNIQDSSVCHVADEHACVVGNYVTVGHRVILHGCTVSDEVLIGMGAILMNGVVVGEQSIIGAAALLTEGLRVPPGSLVYGAPAKVISHLGPAERAKIKGWAEKYCQVAQNYLGHAR
jgi:carbonic anhydrase/acetyltransferase-like protein (isoleucine patch superfamily)